MQIILTAEQEEIVRQRMKLGRYHTPNDVVDEALRLLVEEEILQSVDQEALKATLQRAREQLDRGEGIEITDRKAFVDDVMKRTQEHLGAQKK